MKNRINRWAGAVLLALALAYVPWLIRVANRDALWLAVPFIAANVSMIAGSLLHWVNNWDRRSPMLHHARRGQEPDVAVIVPTYGEPVEMVVRTIASVLDQDYPRQRITIVVSDDAHSEDMGRAISRFARANADAAVLYHRPPAKDSPDRRGEAKAGNLNSAVDFLDAAGIVPPFVETRDADDLVGDPSFLRVCVGQLSAKPELGFVQTVKTAAVPPGDPFGNLNPTFYQTALFAKNAADAAFPCGSGVVWRRAALDDIDGFPQWNLVEDVQSGINAMKRGWCGEALGIVGAHAQHAPDDLPNVFKQRGTWALDSLRLMFWGSLKGLSLRKRLHFYETNLFYLNSLSWLALMLSTVLTLLTGRPLLVDDPWRVTAFLTSMLIAVELFHAAHAYDHGFVGFWRNRQVWANLSFLWAVQIVRALVAGPNRKPRYRVTRKTADHRVHLRLVLPQIVSVVALVVALGTWLQRSGGVARADASGIVWAAYFLVIFGSFIPRAWFGVGSQLQASSLAAGLADSIRRIVGAPDIALSLAPVAASGAVPTIARGRHVHPPAATPHTAAFATHSSTTRLNGHGRHLGRTSPAAGPQRHRPRVAVLGAGIGGLSVARLLRDSNFDVTVYEASDHAGGLAASFRWHGVDCDHGPHRFLPDEDGIVAEIETLVPLRTLVRSSRIRLRNRWVREPINPFELVLKFLPQPGLGLVWGYLKRDKKGPDATFDQQSLARFGTGLNELFFRPYSEKLFGIPASEISPDWGRRKLRAAGLKDLLKKRGRLSFQQFWYPERGGYGAIVDAFAAQVADQIRFNHRLTALEKCEHGGYLCTFEKPNGRPQTTEFDLVVSTLPATMIASMLGNPFELSFRTADLYYLHVAKEQVTPHHWFYFADGLETSVINRVTEFTNFGNPSDEPGTTVVCCEVTHVAGGSLEQVVGELVGAELLTPADILDHKVVHVSHAYPIYDLRSDEELPLMAAFFASHPDLYHVGRSATFAHQDVDEIYVQARDVAAQLRSREVPLDLRANRPIITRFDIQSPARLSRTAS